LGHLDGTFGVRGFGPDVTTHPKSPVPERYASSKRNTQDDGKGSEQVVVRPGRSHVGDYSGGRGADIF
jgi:hypothetical protein